MKFPKIGQKRAKSRKMGKNEKNGQNREKWAKSRKMRKMGKIGQKWTIGEVKMWIMTITIRLHAKTHKALLWYPCGWYVVGGVFQSNNRKRFPPKPKKPDSLVQMGVSTKDLLGFYLDRDFPGLAPDVTFYSISVTVGHFSTIFGHFRGEFHVHTFL